MTTLTKSTPCRHGVRAAAAVLLCASAALAQTYSITDLGTLGGPTSDAFGLNNFGRVAGVSTLMTAHLHGFFRDSNGLTDIPPLFGSESQAYDVNDNYQVVGIYHSLGANVIHGLLWQTGVSTDLGNIAPRGINNAGVVAGYLSTLDPNFGWVDHAARWQNGTIYDLGTLGGHFSYAYAIAEDGRIVGMSYSASDAAHRATLWLNGVPVDLGTPGGARNSHATDINGLGHVVGFEDTATSQTHAFLLTLAANGGVLTRTDLGMLGGGYSYAYALNGYDEVVGASNGAAFVWQNGVMTDLNTLIPSNADWRLDAARTINDRGQIAGLGYHHGQPRGFLLTPLIAGDMNCDGVVDFDDINALVLALGGQGPYEAVYPDCRWMNADCNGDGAVNFDDINAFIAILSG
jgi:probable HAF family extracellular repeat protein